MPSLCAASARRPMTGHAGPSIQQSREALDVFKPVDSKVNAMVQRPPYSVSSHYQPSRPQAYPPSGQAGPQGPTYPQPMPYSVTTHGPAQPQAKPRQVLMAGGSVLALAALLITPNLGKDQVQESSPFSCVKIEQTQSLISRDQLKALLATDLQAPKATVQELLKEPYCVMSSGKTEAGQPADREAYPLEFDPQTWLVVLYEGDRYAGYDFRFR